MSKWIMKTDPQIIASSIISEFIWKFSEKSILGKWVLRSGLIVEIAHVLNERGQRILKL
jgi:hypothetical protein